MLSNVSSSVFTGSDSITLTPVVSAEWNHNLFNAPYITTAGTGTKLTVVPISPLPTNVTSGAKPNFTTKSFAMLPPVSPTPTPVTTSTPSASAFAITGSVVNLTTINVSWSNPPTGTSFYRVQLNGQSDTVPTGTSYTFSGLSSGTAYTVSIDAYNSSFSVIGSTSQSFFTTLEAPLDMVSTGSTSYTISGGSSSAYKVITYVKTSSPIPVMINASGKNSDLEYGSEQVEADSLGWTKVITYVGSQSPDNTFAGFVYTITANSISGEKNNPIVYFTEPEVYATTHFDYQNRSLFPTEMPFTYFRPGESYVQSGNVNSTFPANFRKIISPVIKNYSVSTYSPVTPILQNPRFFLSSKPIPVLKNALPTDTSSYKYFVSDDDSRNITAIYEKAITTNKIVIKFNTLMTVPLVNIAIDGVTITVDGSQDISPPNNSEGGRSNGVLILYWTGSAWTKTKWSSMPKFSDSGSLYLSTSFSKITITQIDRTTNTEFLKFTGETAPSSSGPTINSFSASAATPTGNSLTFGNNTQPVWASFSYSDASSYKITTTTSGSFNTRNSKSDTSSYLGVGSCGTTYSLTLTVYSGQNQQGTSATRTISYTVNCTSKPTVIPSPSSNVVSDLKRMHVVEISPRLEIDLTDFVESLSISKSLDGNSELLPISSLNTNDAQITLSGIPAMVGSTIVPIFSSQSNQSSTILANMLRKNIKFYINFNLASYSTPGSSTTSNTYIPGGVFYSDSWAENDIQNITVQCFDVSRYLQSKPVTDYVVNRKSVFDIITNILDLSGFTDYDYDSLYSVCNSTSAPLDLSYYYCNSKDSTIMECLNELFVAYQIGAYIDEYGVMRFLSLHDILSSSGSNLSLLDGNIMQNGFSISNNAKPGKISLRYQTPKIKQSPSLQNITDDAIANSPSFIYTTSNDVVWSQQTVDSVGFNYLDADMLANSNKFQLNNNDLLDIFHTFNMTNDGFAFIDNEIVSFAYKEYKLSKVNGDNEEFISIKNNIDLTSQIDNYIKKNDIGLRPSTSTITSVSGNGTAITYTSTNSFKVGDKVMITDVVPAVYNIQGIISERTSTTFKVLGTTTGTYVSGGEAYISADYDVLVTPTGKITNVERGLFGTVPIDHIKVTTLASKGLSEKALSSDLQTYSTSSNTSIVSTKTDYPKMPEVKSIAVAASSSLSTLVYPTSKVDIGYKTYSVKFSFAKQHGAAAGLFFNMASTTDSSGSYFVELARYSRVDKKTQAFYNPLKYDYILSIYNDSGVVTGWADVTAECISIVNNFAKVLKKTVTGDVTTFSYDIDECFNLRVAHYLTDGKDGEDATVAAPKNALLVFINNVEITGWQIPGTEYNETTDPSANGWASAQLNKLTGMRQRPTIDNDLVIGTKFGFFASRLPQEITNLYPPKANPEVTSSAPANLREIHATVKPLKERSVSYFYQDREFLNGLVQKQPLYTKSPTYLMQTTPEVSGINYYDVEYQTPAAVSVDVLPIEYMMRYFPGNRTIDKKQYQKKLVDEYSLAYSTPINTGFRARMAIANGSPHMIHLKKDSDDVNNVTVNLNLWTHEIVAPSDPEIIESIIDHSNLSETVQLDSEWIQSKQAAYKMLKVVQRGVEGFSKTVSLNIFGNPLIQVGDTVTLSYSLNGIVEQRYLVHSVSHNFSQGLSTSLNLKRIQE
jgi:hypothetical protein